MAKPIDSVLLAIGPSDRDHVDALVDEAIASAASADATVYLLHVFTRREYDQLLGEMEINPTSGGLPPDELASRHDSIRTPAERLERANVEYEVRGTIGDPVKEIIRIASELGVRRIIIGGEGRSPAGKAVFNDRAQQILLNAPCPVTYIKRT